MKKFTIHLIVTALAITTLAVVTTSAPVLAQTAIEQGVQAARGDGQPANLFGDSGIITTITNTLLFIVGALSVIMIIIGGIRYATSGGNASSVTAA